MGKKGKSINLINTAIELVGLGKDRGVTHLYTENEQLNGRSIIIDGKELINFGSCSYLGLEVRPDVKEASIEAVKNFGTQYSSSRSYVSCSNYFELEELIGKMFDAPILLSTSSTLGHFSVIPIAIEEGDAVILDQQAHVSMQEAVQKMQLRNVTVTMVKHSNLNEVEKKVQELQNTHNKIWYFIDGVYSMYGDFAPIHDIINLLDKYKSLHLYVDDAHGMSWTGKNGTGYILSQIKLHPKMILTTSLAKGFGSAGGVFVFSDEKLRDRIKIWGGPLTYSGPQQPAVVGASIASAKIHLSDEITLLQDDLKKKIAFCNQMIVKYNLPATMPSDSPVFFIGLGLVKVGFNMISRLINDGYYTNIGMFPAVPEHRSGIRFTLTCHHTYEDIEGLIMSIAENLPKALKDEGRTVKDIYRAFKNLIDVKEDIEVSFPDKKKLFDIQHETSIKSISKEIWDELLGDNGAFDWDAMSFYESVFTGNELPENNWNFHYIIIRDTKGKIILATFLTTTIVKDDFFAPESISRQIEEKRVTEPYYLTSKTLLMGSLLTNGQHLYIDKSKSDWKEAIVELLDVIWKIQDNENATSLFLREFDTDDIELRDLFADQGFIKVDLPDNNVIDEINWCDEEDYLLNFLKYKQRYHFKNDVLLHKDLFHVSIAETPSQNELNNWYNLYQNVKARNFAVNDFLLPKKLFFKIAEHPKWEIILIHLKNNKENEDNVIAVGFAYRTSNNYCPVLLGLDYNYQHLKIYKQILYQFVTRAKESDSKKLYFGLTASLEKRKLGAKAIKQSAYLQTKDDFNRLVIGTYNNS